MTVEERLAKLEQQLEAMKTEIHTQKLVVGEQGKKWVTLDTYGLIVNVNGRVAKLDANENGSLLILRKSCDDKRGIWMSVDKDGPKISIQNEDGQSIWTAPE